MGVAASANPAAAMLEGEDAGHRSGVSPVARGGTARNHLIVRACRGSRNGALSAWGGCPATSCAARLSGQLPGTINNNARRKYLIWSLEKDELFDGARAAGGWPG